MSWSYEEASWSGEIGALAAVSLEPSICSCFKLTICSNSWSPKAKRLRIAKSWSSKGVREVIRCLVKYKNILRQYTEKNRKVKRKLAGRLRRSAPSWLLEGKRSVGELWFPEFPSAFGGKDTVESVGRVTSDGGEKIYEEKFTEKKFS